MSPFKGQGANQALLDALSLCKHIQASDIARVGRMPISLSLRAYEEEMLARGRVKAGRSREAARLLHCDAALSKANVTRASAAERKQGQSDVCDPFE